MGFITAMIIIAAVAAVTSVVLGVIQSSQSPKPGKITFGFDGGVGGSPRYGTFGPLDNTISNEIAIPVLYGELKIAGNVIWQSDPGETVKRIVALCEGEINSIADVRANDTPIADITGSSNTNYVGTGTQTADSRISAELRPNMELHFLAYIAVTLVSGEKLKGGNPTVTSVCRGLLVETWNGTSWPSAKNYSRNPSACVRDFIAASRYGLGMPKSNLDEDSFGAAYEYCEELVDSPNGRESRYRLDYIVDAQKSAQDVLNDMLATFQGFLVYAGNKIKLRIEKAENITQYFGDGSTTKANAAFDPNNIVRDSFTWNMSSLDDRPNRIKIQWVDPSQNYVKIYTQIEDRIDQDSRGTIIAKEISLLGITRQTQASRTAKLQMAIMKYANLQIQFSARLESIHCEVGDVVAVTHQSARFTRRLFRITAMQESEDETIRFICREYNASLYDDHQATALVTYDQPTGPNLYAALSDVTGLTLSEDNYKNKDGVFVTNILTSWTAIPGDDLLRLDRHLIQISSDGGVSYRDVAFASADRTSYRIVLGNIQTGTTFSVRVKTISDRGAESPGIAQSIAVTGKDTPPSNVEDFDVQFSVNHLAMTWSAINDFDLFAYEVRVGGRDAMWETAAIVVTELLENKYDLFNFTSGEKKYFVKAIDNSGNYSETAASDSLIITAIPESNVVFTFDFWSRVTEFVHPLEGSITTELDRIPTSDFDPGYNRMTFQPKTDLTWLERQQTVGTYEMMQLSSFRFGLDTFVTTEQTYTTEAVDIGSVTTGTYILDLHTFSHTNLGVVIPEISTSINDISYSSFVPFVSSQYTARYVKFRFKIQATNAETVIRLTGAKITIDLPDKEQNFSNFSISAGGATVFLTGFTSVKSIVMTTVGTSNLIPRVHNQSDLPASFDARLFDVDGITQAGAANIFVKGY